VHDLGGDARFWSAAFGTQPRVMCVLELVRPVCELFSAERMEDCEKENGCRDAVEWIYRDSVR
jgi:hypothetical protein